VFGSLMLHSHDCVPRAQDALYEASGSHTLISDVPLFAQAKYGISVIAVSCAGWVDNSLYNAVPEPVGPAAGAERDAAQADVGAAGRVRQHAAASSSMDGGNRRALLRGLSRTAASL
jgi:hypothetical protein